MPNMPNMKKFDVPKKSKNPSGGFDSKGLDKKINRIVEIQDHLPREMIAEMLLDLMKEYKHKFDK